MTKELGKMINQAELQSNWNALSPILHIADEAAYDRALQTVEWLMQEVGEDATHALAGLLDTLFTLIEDYEGENHPVPDATGVDVLKFLMQEHDLKQADLSEIGSQGVVSEILNGKRDLNKRHILLLADRFNVSPATFL